MIYLLGVSFSFGGAWMELVPLSYLRCSFVRCNR